LFFGQKEAIKMSLELEYFYGKEAEQYSFYRIPKVLLTSPQYKSVSMEAKVLYGLMLDRMGLSVRNSWLDDKSRVFIYFTLEDSMETMGCGHNKAVKLFADLEHIGLIERKKQGQGKPTKIYVKNFILPSDPEEPAGPEQPQAPLDGETSSLGKSAIPAPQETKTSASGKSALPTTGSLDFLKAETNKTDKNHTELSDTELSIHPPTPTPLRKRRQSDASARDRIDQINSYRALIYENIGYGDLIREHPYDADLIDGYVELMVEVCCSRRETIRVNQEDIPTSVVRSRFLKLDREHILYVMETMQRNTTQIGNIRAYTLSALYNAPVTIGHYYTAQVNYDMAQGFQGRAGA